MKNKYFWQGEPVKTTFGYCSIKKHDDKPMMWWNALCDDDGYALIEAVRVDAEIYGIFYIANFGGIGAYKLKRGGWPDCTHYSIPSDSSFTEERYGNKRELDEEEYASVSCKIRTYQKINFPEEFEQGEALRALANRFNVKHKQNV